MARYHDEEWGVPLHDDRRHFEFLVLDAFQAGLSWRTILHRRENFRKAFSRFNPKLIAKYGAADVRRLLKDEGIIRNRLKIEGTIRNARTFLQIQKEFGSFDAFIWRFAGGRNAWKSIKELPATSDESDAMSADLKERGMTFVGSTICYAYMQAAGLVNDHLVGCPRYFLCGSSLRKRKSS